MNDVTLKRNKSINKTASYTNEEVTHTYTQCIICVFTMYNVQCDTMYIIYTQ